MTLLSLLLFAFMTPIVTRIGALEGLGWGRGVSQGVFGGFVCGEDKCLTPPYVCKT